METLARCLGTPPWGVTGGGLTSEPGSVFDESSGVLRESFSTPTSVFIFPCQVKHICPGRTTRPDCHICAAEAASQRTRPQLLI